MSTCEAGDCNAEAKHRGRCGPHYRILLLQGDRLLTRATKPAEERFWSKVNKSGPIPLHGDVPGPCWQWTAGKIPNGYGSFHVASLRPVAAHRYAWENLRGPIPDGLTIDHLCRNKLCVNPDHLEVVTRGENTLRAVDIGARNRSKTRCINGHGFTPENTRITPSKRRRCRACDRDRERDRQRNRPTEEVLALEAQRRTEAYETDRIHN